MVADQCETQILKHKRKEATEDLLRERIKILAFPDQCLSVFIRGKGSVSSDPRSSAQICGKQRFFAKVFYA
jgi:hypothetical protein